MGVKMKQHYFKHDSIWDKDSIYILCFPKGGGVTSDYYKMNQFATENIMFLPITLSGHEKRVDEPIITVIEEIVTEIAYEMRAYINYRFAIFGDCFGGILAYELARALNSLYGMNIKKLYIKNLPAPIKNTVRKSEEKLHTLSEKEFTNVLVKEGVIPQSVLENRELLELIIPGIQSDYQMYENYVRAERELSHFPASIFLDKSTTEATADEMVGWKQLTDGEVNIIEYRSDENLLPDEFIVKQIETSIK